MAIFRSDVWFIRYVCEFIGNGFSAGRATKIPLPSIRAAGFVFMRKGIRASVFGGTLFCGGFALYHRSQPATFRYSPLFFRR